ncbi:hypothetical protein ACOSQ2_014421 [Xanthoceras sorbifolium]
MEIGDIAELCSSLSIKEGDGSVNVLGEGLWHVGGQKMAGCLVGKVFANKLINRDAFRRVIGRIWRTIDEVVVEVIRGNIFAFHFKSQTDRYRVLSGEPWCFDNALLVLEAPTGLRDIARMKFDRVAFWIQIHNVPLLCMTKDIGAYLGGLIGEVQDVDLGASGDCLGKFLRVWVFVDANKPLKHLLRVDLAGTDEITVMVLRYERLPDFCCKCGLIGHVARECPAAGTSAASSSSAGPEFGLWLRATSPSRSVGVGFRHYMIRLSNQNSGRSAGGVSASVNRDLLASSRGVSSTGACYFYSG